MPPVFSVKGSIGHSLGPCGLLEVIVALRCLGDQTAPPVTGLQNPEPGIGDYMTTEVKGIDGRFALTTNSGFGGINTAVVLEKA